MTWLSEAGEIINSIIQQGGDRALWGLGMYLGYYLVNSLLVFSAFLITVRSVARSFQAYYTEWRKIREQSISLASDKAIKDLESALANRESDTSSKFAALKSAFQELAKSLDEISQKVDKIHASSQTAKAQK